MASLIPLYLASLEVLGRSPLTLKAYRLDLERAQRDLGMLLEQATSDELELLMAAWSKSGMDARTIRRKQASLRGFYGWAFRKKRIAGDPSGDMQAPKLTDRLPVYLRGAEVDQLTAYLAEPAQGLEERRAKAIAGLLYYTGMRSIEAARLTVGAVDLGGLTLRVFGKGGRERELPIAEALAPLLRAWLEVHPLRAKLTPAASLFVALRRPHAALRWDGLDADVKATMQAAGLGGRKITCHKLRHTFATRLINRKVTIDKIQKLLGHKRIDTTTVYAHTELGAELRGDLDRIL